MTGPFPTVYVYGEIVDPNGHHYWLQYVAVGSDQEAAANLAIRAWSGLRVLRVETFAGEPQRFMPGAKPYYDVGAVPAE